MLPHFLALTFFIVFFEAFFIAFFIAAFFIALFVALFGAACGSSRGFINDLNDTMLLQSSRRMVERGGNNKSLSPQTTALGMVVQDKNKQLEARSRPQGMLEKRLCQNGYKECIKKKYIIIYQNL